MGDRRLPLDDFSPPPQVLSPSAGFQAWRLRPPVLRGPQVLIRELAPHDAVPLLEVLSHEEMARFVSPPPSDAAALECFIRQAQDARAAGETLCAGIVPAGLLHPVGVFQVRQMEREFGVAEWSFAIARRYWGDGLFYAAAPLLVDFVFDVLGARRLEARTALANGRGNGALRKLGAVQEALLRHALDQDGEPVDQVLWAILADEWRARCPARNLRVH